MLILSKYHDYYDTAIGYGGIDKTIVYERELKEVKDDAFYKTELTSYSRTIYHSDFRDLYSRFSDGEYWTYFLIGFCGKTYLGVKIEKRNKANECESIKYYYGEEILTQIPNRTERRKYRKWWYRPGGQMKDMDIITKYHNKEHIDLFFKYKIPSFIKVVSKLDILILNPVLKDWDFMQIFDPFTAFQEIQMFISGVLGTKENNIIITADKYKILAAGFDLKTSFRKPKEE